MKNLTRFLLLLAYTAAATAQQTADLYQVEIIIFKQSEIQSVIDKIKNVNRPQENRHQGRAALDLFHSSGDIQAVPTEQLLLTSEALKIEQDGRYELLYHGAWQQPPYDLAQALYIDILEGPKSGLIKATAWLSRERRYFKLLLDFQYDPDFSQASDAMELPKTLLIPIHLERIILEEKLYYLDHPLLGAIVVVSPIISPTT